MVIRLASWNVNSIQARLERVQHFLARESLDVLCLQELKGESTKFPTDIFREMGFHHQAVFGQKSYNGVAILSKSELTDIEHIVFDEKNEARAVRACTQGVCVVCVYVVNGKDVKTEEFHRKLNWCEKLASYIENLKSQFDRIVVCGDFNITPTDLDSCDPIKWKEDLFHSTLERNVLGKILDLGFTDSYRLHHSEQKFSWWDYRNLSFVKNQGLRIDLILVSEALKKNCVETAILRDYRKEKIEGLTSESKPSDHVPIIIGIEV